MNVDLRRTRVPIDVAFLCLSVGLQTVEILEAVDHALPREFELGQESNRVLRRVGENIVVARVAVTRVRVVDRGAGRWSPSSISLRSSVTVALRVQSSVSSVSQCGYAPMK